MTWGQRVGEHAHSQQCLSVKRHEFCTGGMKCLRLAAELFPLLVETTIDDTVLPLSSTDTTLRCRFHLKAEYRVEKWKIVFFSHVLPLRLAEDSRRQPDA